jgi:sortase A
MKHAVAKDRRLPSTEIVIVLIGVLLVSVGLWNGYLSGYLKSNGDSEHAKQLFESPRVLPSSSPTSPVPPPEQLIKGIPSYGQNFAIMRIPVLGPDWVRTISEGTSPRILDRLGTGHYEGTEFPGEVGNFAVAGHSGNKWTPFAHYQEIKNGDLIEIETYDTKFTYQVVEKTIVDETNMKTIYENPKIKSIATGKRWLTITTCLTEGPSNKRIAIYSKLVSEEGKE